ncbi:MAG: hypothetical protein L0H94_05480 [Nitrospira sp.]|nr:hypothetical protein [Nitrospira sp.]
MKTSILSLALVSAALALGVSPASAVTIDFESLMHADSNTVFHGTSYSEDGFMLSGFLPGVVQMIFSQWARSTRNLAAPLRCLTALEMA